MTWIDLPGDEFNAFDHLSAYGVAAILDAAAPGQMRLGWTDTLDPQIRLSGADWETIGTVVHAHAREHTDPGSWVQADGLNAGVARGLFSPRVKAMGPDEVRTWYADREDYLDIVAGPFARLDLAMIGVLGIPSYWSFDRGEPRPDHGASRWEMKTRNRGEEFVTNRLRLLAASVAARTPEQVASGLAGKTRVDETGKDRNDSRTPTGLMPPGPTDNARAWSALWGLSLLPVIHSTTGASQTAGHLGHHSRGWFHLPIMIGMWPLARLRSVLVSRQQFVAATTGLEPADHASVQVSDADRVAAWAWLTARDVPAVVRFPVYRSANKSAPEKWAQRGFRVLPEPLR